MLQHDASYLKESEKKRCKYEAQKKNKQSKSITSLWILILNYISMSLIMIFFSIESGLTFIFNNWHCLWHSVTMKDTNWFRISSPDLPISGRVARNISSLGCFPRDFQPAMLIFVALFKWFQAFLVLLQDFNCYRWSSLILYTFPTGAIFLF